MRRNNQLWLILAIVWIILVVISPKMIQRALHMTLAISCLSMYIPIQFSTTSRQKMYLHKINVVALLAAAIFLILEIYCMFIA